MKIAYIQLHIVLIIFITMMYVLDNIGRTDAILLLILLEITLNKKNEK